MRDGPVGAEDVAHVLDDCDACLTDRVDRVDKADVEDRLELRVEELLACRCVPWDDP